MYNVIALDIEGTLISNAMSQIPRPGLKSFLEELESIFPRIVIFTTVKESLFRDIAQLLISEGVAPDWFLTLEYINWQGEFKDLSLILNSSVSECLLVDDYVGYIHPNQKENWMPIKCFEHPYVDSDNELAVTLDELKLRIKQIY